LLGNTKNQSSLYIYCRAALSLRGTVGESSRHGVWESLMYTVVANVMNLMLYLNCFT